MIYLTSVNTYGRGQIPAKEHIATTVSCQKDSSWNLRVPTHTLIMTWLHDKLLWKKKKYKKFSHEQGQNTERQSDRMENPFSLIINNRMVKKKNQTTLEQMKVAWNEFWIDQRMKRACPVKNA